MLDGDYLLISNEKQKYINVFNYVFNYAYSVIIVELESTNPIYIYVTAYPDNLFCNFQQIVDSKF